MMQDVRAAARWLATRPNVRPDAIGIVGASLGASLALLAAIDLPQVRAIALLSPSLDYRGLRTDVGLIKRLGAHDTGAEATRGRLVGRQRRRSAGATHAARYSC